MIIDCISDLHGHYPKLEGGDLLIVAGDLTATDKPNQYADFVIWLQSQKYTRKIVVGGNHDNFIRENAAWADICDLGFTYLCDSGTEIEYNEEFEPEPSGDSRPDCRFYRTNKLKLWGSPWTKRFPGMNPHCMAFTVDTDEELLEKWEMIPDDTDILITHCPPHGCYLDQDRLGNMLGSITLRDRIYPFSKFKPKLHVFGHIHEGYGVHPVIGRPNMVNASHVNENYEPVNKPIRVIL